MRQRTVAVLATLGMVLGVALPARAGVTVYEKDGKKIEIGGRVQVLYVYVDPACDPGTPCLISDSGTISDSGEDRLVFRRLRPYIAGTITENWMAKIEFDFGEAEDSDEVQVKDAYFVRTGFNNKHSKLTIGNSKSVFAREFLNSSSSLQLVERGFTGDHNFGVPDRALGVRWDSGLRDGKVSYAVNVGSEGHDPAVNRVDMDTPSNGASDWNQGWVAAARVDFMPLGYFKMSQADFARGSSKVSLGLSAFIWNNDSDNNTYTDMNGNATSMEKVDLDEADGFETSFAYRGHGVSVDAEYQQVSGDTVDPAFTGGVYRDGATELNKFSVVGGYLFPKDRFEVVLGWDSQDADNYDDAFTRTSLGVNFYLNQHNLKFQVTYRKVDNFIGQQDQDQNVLFASTQFKF